MDFFDKLGTTISTKGKEVTGKAKDLAEVANLKSQISTCESVIKKNYIEIGKKYYDMHLLRKMSMKSSAEPLPMHRMPW